MSTAHYFDKCFEKHPDIVCREIAGEIVLVPIRRRTTDVDSVYTMDEVGARIWELIDGKAQVSAIRDAIAAEFDVSPEQAGNDLADFLRQLETAGAVREI